MDSKFIKDETDLKIWQSLYMNKTVQELNHYFNDTNNHKNAFRPNLFDL